ncbi:hypothetical protein IR117_09420, partial [Streptococcus danieliae]|nr:hypothetical protein [Streptococcus danieliae]
NAAKGFVSQAASVGADLISGFVEGVAGAAGKLIDSVKGVVGDAISAAKSLLGIKSPSRVFKAFGIYTDQGFINGIKAKGGRVVNSVKDMVHGAVRAFNHQDLAGNFQKSINDVNHMMRQTWDSMTQGLAIDQTLRGMVSGSVQTQVAVDLGRNTQPMQVNLSLGNRDYSSFVADITDKQNANARLEEAY